MDSWHYESAGDLDQPLVERLRRFPREPDMLVYGLRWLSASVIRTWLKLYHRLTIAGRENLPATGSYVLAVNHTSHLDALCVLAALPMNKLHRAFPAAARDYFFVNTPRVYLAAIVVNALPFDRTMGRRHGLDLCRHLLENPGNILILFPEGTRTTTGALGNFKPGIGLLLAGHPIPVVPCYLDGAFAAFPKGAWVPRPRRLHLSIGTPRSYGALERTKASALHVCVDLQNAVRELSARKPLRPQGDADRLNEV